jgi:hypothetical protein
VSAEVDVPPFGFLHIFLQTDIPYQRCVFFGGQANFALALQHALNDRVRLLQTISFLPQCGVFAVGLEKVSGNIAVDFGKSVLNPFGQIEKRIICVQKIISLYFYILIAAESEINRKQENYLHPTYTLGVGYRVF